MKNVISAALSVLVMTFLLGGMGTTDTIIAMLGVCIYFQLEDITKKMGDKS